MVMIFLVMEQIYKQSGYFLLRLKIIRVNYDEDQASKKLSGTRINSSISIRK